MKASLEDFLVLHRGVIPEEAQDFGGGHGSFQVGKHGNNERNVSAVRKKNRCKNLWGCYGTIWHHQLQRDLGRAGHRLGRHEGCPCPFQPMIRNHQIIFSFVCMQLSGCSACRGLLTGMNHVSEVIEGMSVALVTRLLSKKN